MSFVQLDQVSLPEMTDSNVDVEQVLKNEDQEDISSSASSAEDPPNPVSCPATPLLDTQHGHASVGQAGIGGQQNRKTREKDEQNLEREKI